MRISFRRFMLGVVSVALFLSSTSGCSSHSVSSPQYEVELVTVEDQARATLLETPTDFVVPYTADQDAWERTLFFFKHYTELETPYIRLLPNDVTQISNSRQPEGSQYIYTVQRIPVHSGMKYSVRCAPRAQANEGAVVADLNARNAARFIRIGELERTLFVQ